MCILRYSVGTASRIELQLRDYDADSGGFRLAVVAYKVPTDGDQSLWGTTGPIRVPLNTWTWVEVAAPGYGNGQHTYRINGIEITTLQAVGGLDDVTGAWFEDCPAGSYLAVGAQYQPGQIYVPFTGSMACIAVSDDYASGASLGFDTTVPEGATSAWPFAEGTGYIAGDQVDSVDLQLGSTPGEDTATPTWTGPYTDIGSSGPVALLRDALPH